MEVRLRSTMQLRPGTFSLADSFMQLPLKLRTERLGEMTDEECLQLQYDWRFWARVKQTAPVNRYWFIWMLMAGRGFGKTRTGAEFIREQVEGGYNGRIHLIGPTAADVRDVMVEGDSGILDVSPPWNRPVYEPSKRRLTWPNGARASLFSAEEPERLRGPQCGLLWADEVGAWRFAAAWDLAMFGLRIGDPKAVVTTTPRPTQLVRDILLTEGCVTTVGTSYENRTNLAPEFYGAIIKKYEGTRLGRQELEAQLLEDTPGALWTIDVIDDNRVSYEKFQGVELVRIAVAIDPAVSAKETSNETGILAGGVDANGEGYLLADGSGIYTPLEWANVAIGLYDSLRADGIVAEVNNGGDLVEANLRTVNPQVPYKKVHASRGKRARAEPVSTLYERGLIHHVGTFPETEDQQTTWDSTDGSKSPDRVDALVWLFSHLMLGRTMKKAVSRSGGARGPRAGRRDRVVGRMSSPSLRSTTMEPAKQEGARGKKKARSRRG